jgi:CYTH domain-containing protein
MVFEIERKFLVCGDAGRTAASNLYFRGYASADNGVYR